MAKCTKFERDQAYSDENRDVQCQDLHMRSAVGNFTTCHAVCLIRACLRRWVHRLG